MTNSSIGIPTPHGIFVATYSQTGLSRLEFPEKVTPLKTNPTLTGLAKRWQATVAKPLEKMLHVQAPGNLPPLDLSSGTEFQIGVWRQLLQIPLGQARSYGKLARGSASPVHLAPWAAPAAPIRSRSSSPATACSPRTAASAASPVAPVGNSVS